MQQRDVATRLGITTKAVETRIRRARLWLRQELGMRAQGRACAVLPA